MITLLLLLHALAAVALLGTVTHQVLAASATRAAGTRSPSRTSFFTRFRATDPTAYANAVCWLAAIVILLGSLLYPSYRLFVRPVLQAQGLRAANGAFELKEHFAALILLMLPAYWAAWQRPLAPEDAGARIWLTWIFAALVWWNFIVGDVLTIIKGPLA